MKDIFKGRKEGINQIIKLKLHLDLPQCQRCLMLLRNPPEE